MPPMPAVPVTPPRPLAPAPPPPAPELPATPATPVVPAAPVMPPAPAAPVMPPAPAVPVPPIGTQLPVGSTHDHDQRRGLAALDVGRVLRSPCPTRRLPSSMVASNVTRPRHLSRKVDADLIRLRRRQPHRRKSRREVAVGGDGQPHVFQVDRAPRRTRRSPERRSAPATGSRTTVSDAIAAAAASNSPRPPRRFIDRFFPPDTTDRGWPATPRAARRRPRHPRLSRTTT